MTGPFVSCALLFFQLQAAAAPKATSPAPGEKACAKEQKLADDPKAGCEALKQARQAARRQTFSPLCAGVENHLAGRIAYQCDLDARKETQTFPPEQPPACPDFDRALETLETCEARQASCDLPSDRGALKAAAERCLRRNPPRPIETEVVFEVLRAGLDECLEERCREVNELRAELARASVAHLRVVGPFSSKGMRIQRALIALGSTNELIALLEERGLDDRQARKLIQIALTGGRARDALGEIADRLAGLNEAPSTEILQIFDQAIRLDEQNKGDPDKLRLRLQLAEVLGDETARNQLVNAAKAISKEHPDLREMAARALQELTKDRSAMNRDVVISFLAALSPLVISQYQVLADRALVYPGSERDADRDVGMFPIFFIRDATPESSTTCDTERQLLRHFGRLIHFNFGPKSGVSPPMEVTSREGVEEREVPERLRDLLSGEHVNFDRVRRSWPCSARRGLCSWPVEGAYLFRFRQEPHGKLGVSARWWARATLPTSEKVDEGELKLDQRVVPCDELSIAQAASALALKASTEVATLKQSPPPAIFQSRRTGSPWSAALFAGAPFLLDDRASTASRVIPSALDGMFLVGAGGCAALAVKLRNDYAHSTRATKSLAPANHAADAAIGLAAGLILTRITSGLVAHFSSSR